MKQIAVLLLLSFGAMLSSLASTQESAADRAASLRLQLNELEIRKSELTDELQQIEENLKPENIERALSGVGSVHPEELRAQRTRILERDKARVRNQLDQLEIKRSQLEAAIANADNAAYHESAGVNPTTGVVEPNRVRYRSRSHKNTKKKKKSKSKPKSSVSTP